VTTGWEQDIQEIISRWGYTSAVSFMPDFHPTITCVCGAARDDVKASKPVNHHGR